MTKEMGIGEVARQAGIRPSAIRYYESTQVLPPPRLVSMKRRYTAEIFQQLALIKIAQEVGLTVVEMCQALNGTKAWRTLVQQKLLDTEKQMQHLRKVKVLLTEALRQEHMTAEEAIYLFHSLKEGEAGEKE